MNEEDSFLGLEKYDIPRQEYYDPEGNPIGLIDWSKLFALRTSDPDTSWWKKCSVVGDLTVSTVWIGMDHGISCSDKPLIYETMIFTNSGDQYQEEESCWRYPTREEAWAHHDQLVSDLRREEENQNDTLPPTSWHSSWI